MLNIFNKIMISSFIYSIIYYIFGVILFGGGIADWKQWGITLYFFSMIFTIISLLGLKEDNSAYSSLQKTRVIYVGTIFILFFIQILLKII